METANNCDTSIPHVIHYCWFGENSPGEVERVCMESWGRLCPGYEIRRWDESNIDISGNAFASAAYERGKWAFVSDYARFKVLYDHGGVYLDTDVELFRGLDCLLAGGAYMGYERDPDEQEGINGRVNAGLGMAFPAGHPFLKRVLDVYEHLEFPQEGNLGDHTVVQVVTDLLEQDGMQPVIEGQMVDGVRLLPRRYLDPMDRWTGEVTRTEDTVSIHRYGATWVSRSARMELSLAGRLIRFGVPRARALKLAKVLAVLVCLDVSRMGSFLRRESGDRA